MYKVLTVGSFLESEEKLNALAKEGWELVTAIVVSGTPIFYLKK